MLFVTAVAGRIYLRYATRNHNSCTNVYQRQAGNLKQQAAGDEALGGYIRKAKCIFIRQKLNSTQDPYLTAEKNRCAERSMCKIFNMMLLSSLWTSRNSQRDLSSAWKGTRISHLKVGYHTHAFYSYLLTTTPTLHNTTYSYTLSPKTAIETTRNSGSFATSRPNR